MRGRHVVALARIGAALFIAGFIALAIDIWRNARLA
jgi:uncharacterized membrane protein YgdD (TMEM256/DUF423 family)